MKVRKLAVALALAGGLGSGVAQALGLGEIELQSYLNEPLDAEINLRKSTGVAPNDVFVNIAPQTAYNQVGIDRSYFLTKLNFQVVTAPDGNLVVNVSSREPLREPYLNFLLEVTWPNGRLMREYAVLVDPPVYAEESGVEEQVAAPATQRVTQPAQQTRQSTQARPSRTVTPSRTSGARTLGPTNSADTLWTIAAQIRPDNSVSMQQVMLAIQDLNPNAFIDGNINRLKRGEILRIPDLEQIQRRSRSAANQEVAAQNQAFSTPKQTVDATAGRDQTGTAAGDSSGGDQLRLVTADEVASRDAADGGSAGGDSSVAGGVDAGSAVAMEELESTRRENDELSGRVDDLQDQVETLKRLLELKNSQLAEMQNAEMDGSAGTVGEAATGQKPSAEESMAPEMAGTENSSEPSVSDEGLAGEGLAGEGVAEESMATEAGDNALQAEGEDISAEMAESGEPVDGAMAADAGDEMAEASESQESMAGSESPMATDEVTAESAPEVAQEPAVQEQPVVEPEPVQPAQKPFPGNIIDAISSNYLYQVALGGGLIVLLLLLLALARRNANREKAFYDELNGGSEEDNESFDLSFDEDESAEGKSDDAMAEADAYIAYGRNDQAAQVLETAISREPSRTDLRLKLLGVYADSQDRDSFEKQFGEIEALDDEDALAEAQSLHARLEEAESMPSIDDLESQLRTGGSVEETSDSDSDLGSEPDKEDSFELSDDFEAQKGEQKIESDEVDFSADFEDMDLDLPDEEDKPESVELADSVELDEDPNDDMIEYDLSNLEESEADDSDRESLELSEADEDFDFLLEEDSKTGEDKQDDDDLSLDFDTSDLGLEETSETEDSTVSDVDLGEEDLSLDLESDEDSLELDNVDAEKSEVEAESDALDESFLDDLDAELDKVAGEDGQDGESEVRELDDLELDVSDEDLALMEEFSEGDDTAEDDLGLEDALSGEEPADPEQAVEAAETAEGLPEATPEDSDEDSVPPVASNAAAGASSSSSDLDETDLGDDDDFDFLAGTDEAATKLDLARAYVEMGDVDGARDILEEVALEGDDEQKAEAQDLLKNLS